MTKTRKNSVSDQELQIKQLQTNLEKERKLMERMQEENCLKQTEINVNNSVNTHIKKTWCICLFYSIFSAFIYFILIFFVFLKIIFVLSLTLF